MTSPQQLAWPATAPGAQLRFWTRATVALLVLGLAASLVALVVLQEASRAQSVPELGFAVQTVRPPLYYAAHGVEILCLLAAAVTAFLFVDLRQLGAWSIGRLGLLAAAAILMAARGYSSDDLASSRIFDGTGPVVFIIVVLALATVPQANWHVLGRLLTAAAILLSLLTVATIPTITSASRLEAVLALAPFLNALFWPACWLILVDAPRAALRSIPMAIYAAGSFLSQTRLNFVMLAAFALLALWMFARRGRPVGPALVALVVLGVWTALFALVALPGSSLHVRAAEVWEAFDARLTEDTRTGQFVYFFQDVEPHELAFGRGSLATWNWNGYPWTGGTDLGYLTLLFYGGVPLLVAFVLTHVGPSFSTLFASTNPMRQACAAVVALFCVRMFSSSYPGLTLEYYLVLICLGPCLARPDSQPARRLE